MTQPERSNLPSPHLDDERLHEQPHDAALGAAPPVAPASGARLGRIAVISGLVLLVLLVVTLLPRFTVHRELLADAAARDSAPAVEVTTVQRATPGSVVTLPGTVQPLHESAIYARVSGYVRRWHADIGTLVRQGTVLADIDAPELEQNVQQARSQVAMTHAALDLARADLARWTSLARDSAVTGQELDQKRAAFASAQANTGAAEANLRRLVQTGEYTRVVAPFTGVITARNVDIGSLITVSGATSSPLGNGGSSVANAGNLFRIAQTDTVRTYVTVPATYATSVRPGLAADVTVQGISGRTFAGTLSRTSASLDAATRTLLAEIDIPNRDFAILPGMYAQVTLHFPRATPPLMVPASALVIRSAGPQVMVLTRTNAPTATVHLQSVTVGRDYGSTIEITDGLVDGSTVVTTPSADLDEGTKVRVTPTKR
ncbi:MAG TPA: efflux RND transporter periplasmic adaptor subunit [Gemmatimonadaceae bacterium]|jgi:RND family efflux transporter MFP subunit|nr:efflux RND transporter periplasmic adaptor subunit [Gemmatimonadaceae bacterium]